MATDVRSPTSDAAVVGTWLYSSGTTGWNLVDEYPTPDDTDYIVAAGGAGTISYTFGFTPFSVPTGSTSLSLTIYWRAADVILGLNNTLPVLTVNGTVYFGTSTNPSATPTTYNSMTVGSQWTTNPDTSAAWTVDDINGSGSNPLEAFGVGSSDVNPDVRNYQVYAEVTYTPPAGGITAKQKASMFQVF